MNDDIRRETVRAVIAERASLDGALLPILHGVQDALGFIPREAIDDIAEALHLSRAEVHGVRSYYTHFRSAPAGRVVVQVCRAESCRSVGGETLLAQARAALGCSAVEPTSADGVYSVEPVYCLGLCSVSPAARVGEQPFARLTSTRLDAAVAAATAHADSPTTATTAARAESPTTAIAAATASATATEIAPAGAIATATSELASRATPSAIARADAAPTKVFVPRDSAALAVGADEVAAEIVSLCRRRRLDIEVVRTSSRGLHWLEPLVEVDTPDGRLGFGPLSIADVAEFVEGWVSAPIGARADPSAATRDDRVLVDKSGGRSGPCIGLVDRLSYLQRQQRLTFARAGLTDPLSLADYQAHGGLRGLRTATASAPVDVWQAVLDSGLRGRGGAAFPAGIKWRTVAAAKAAQKYVVCNADEGDSGTFADRMVMEGDPFLLIEGMAICGLACGATMGFVYIRSEYPDAVRTMDEAIAIARRAGVLGADVLGSGRAFDLQTRMGAGSYVCGEETAMLESLEGRRGIVRAKPPLPALQGLFGRPTVVNNVLTFAAVPTIVADGAAAYRSIGAGRSTGTQPFQLAGNVARPGLVELAFGTTLRELLFDFGGGTASGRPVKAVQVGGPLGAYIPERNWDVPLDYEAYAGIGAVLGHGGIVVHDDTADLAALARYAMEFCAIESCGKCTPCRVGSTRGAEVIDRLVAGAGPGGRAGQEALLRDLCDTMVHGSLCAMGGMTPFPVLSALDHYPADFGLPAAPRDRAA